MKGQALYTVNVRAAAIRIPELIVRKAVACFMMMIKVAGFGGKSRYGLKKAGSLAGPVFILSPAYLGTAESSLLVECGQSQPMLDEIDCRLTQRRRRPRRPHGLKCGAHVLCLVIAMKLVAT